MGRGYMQDERSAHIVVQGTCKESCKPEDKALKPMLVRKRVSLGARDTVWQGSCLNT
jgi:hypothetical protein